MLKNLREKFKKIKLTEVMFIDIETSRQVDILDEDSPLYDLCEYTHRYKKEFQNYEGVQEAFKDKAALFPEMGMIVCISIGIINGDKLRVTSFYGDNEKEILTEFKGFLNSLNNKYKVFCHFAGTGFDIPYIILRSLANGIVDIPDILDESDCKPWEKKNIDLKDYTRLDRYSPSSLLGLATLLNVESSKNTITGAEVSDAFFRGDIEIIKDYCEADVYCTNSCLLKLMGYQLLEFESVKLTKKYGEKKYLSELDKLYETHEYNPIVLAKEGSKLTKKEQEYYTTLVKVMK